MNNLIEANEGLIRKIADYYVKRNPSILASPEDYYQEACIGLIKAHKNYDKSRSSWSTYATRVMCNHLIEFAKQNNSHLSIKSCTYNMCIKIFKLQSLDVPQDEICQILGISSKRFYEVKDILSRFAGELPSERPNKRGDDFVGEIDLSEDLKSFLAEDERKILDMHLGGYSIIQISEHNNLDVNQNRYLLQGVKKKLEHYLEL